MVNPNTQFKTSEWIERVVFLGLAHKPSNIVGSSACKYLNTLFYLLSKNLRNNMLISFLCVIAIPSVTLEAEGEHPLVIRKPGFLVAEDWKIKLN